jgi:RNA:NAD 2'-phosphotransferase (TPT1/KptA family)
MWWMWSKAVGAGVRELVFPLPEEGADADFSFRAGEGYFFRWNRGELVTWNAHPTAADMDEGERERAFAEIKLGGPGVEGMVDHATRVVAIEPDIDVTKWQAKLTGDLKTIQSVLRSLRRHDPRIADGYDVRLQSGFSRHLGNRPSADTATVGDTMSRKPVQPGERGRTVRLYHGTNSALLPTILREGLRPNRETGVKNWTGTELRHNVAAIYLASDVERARYYAEHSAEEQRAAGRLDAEPVVLVVAVPTDGLLADDDWLRREFGDAAQSHASDWHASLTQFGQVAFLGKIPAAAVEVAEGGPTEAREHEFGAFATGGENLSSALASALDAKPDAAGRLAKLVARWWGEDFYDEMSGLSDDTSADELIGAVEAVEGRSPWETDYDVVMERVELDARDAGLEGDEGELLEEALAEDRDRLRRERAGLAKELQGAFDSAPAPAAAGKRAASARRADVTGPKDSGQLIQYYRGEKYPPGVRDPSVWDEEEDDPATRLGEPETSARGQPQRAAGYLGIPEGRPVPVPAWEDSEHRLGPDATWDDHRYRRRAPNGLNRGPDEGGEDPLSDVVTWPVRRGYHAVSRMLAASGEEHVYHGTSLEQLRTIRDSGWLARGLYLADVREKAEDYASRQAERDDSPPVVLQFDLSTLRRLGQVEIDPGSNPDEWEHDMGQFTYSGPLEGAVLNQGEVVDELRDEGEDFDFAQRG